MREEGASLFQGFSFERPSLLQRRRSRPHHKPVEDCFQDLRLSCEADSVPKSCSLVDSVFGDENAELAHTSSCDAVQVTMNWFDIPPEDDFEELRSTSPTDYDGIEDDILGGVRLKQGSESVRNRPKVYAILSVN